MDILKAAIWFLNVLSAVIAIVLILMQQGKGADAGASFGSGSAQGVFGAAGSANFLSRSTAIAASVFFATCLALGYLTTHHSSGLDFSDVKQSPSSVVPAASSAAPAAPANTPASANKVLPD